MTMDDPGWGDYTPLVGDDTAPAPVEPPTQPAGPTPPGPPSPRGGRLPPWLSPVRLAIGSAVVVVAIVVGLVVALSSGSSSPSGPKLLAKADFITQADAICLNFRDQIQSATASGDMTLLASVGQSELDQIRKLGDPDQDAALIHTFLNDETQAINFLGQGDSVDANPVIAAGDAAAGQFGMRVCNYGQ
jgi:hypothetical protein